MTADVLELAAAPTDLPLLARLTEPADLRGLDTSELTALCRDIRDFLVHAVTPAARRALRQVAEDCEDVARYGCRGAP